MLIRILSALVMICAAVASPSQIKNSMYKEIKYKTRLKDGVEYIPLEGGMRFTNSAWGSIGYTREGFVYVVVCDHIGNSVIYEYNTKNGKLFTLGDVNNHLGIKSFAERQPKVHTPLLQYEKNGLVYFGTDAGDNSEWVMYDHPSEGYTGGYFASLNPVTKEIKNIGKPKPYSGFKSLLIDQEKGVIYSTMPSGGYLISYDIAANSFELLGKVNGMDIPRTLFIDKWGSVYSATECSELWRYDPSAGKIDFLPVILPGASVTGPSQVAYGQNGDCVYGVTHYTGHVYKYTPEKNGLGKIDSIANVSYKGMTAGLRNLNIQGDRLYMVVNGKELEEGGTEDSSSIARLTVVNVKTGDIEKRIELDDAIRLAYGHPVSDSRGNCYTTGFMDTMGYKKYLGKKAVVYLLKFNPKKL